VAGSGLTDAAGTPLYLAPEVFAHQPATRASDVYSLACPYHLVSVPIRCPGQTASKSSKDTTRGGARARDIRRDPEGFVQRSSRRSRPIPSAVIGLLENLSMPQE
jgi:serine/threonine protein kinase